jgi:ribosomal protein S16
MSVRRVSAAVLSLAFVAASAHAGEKFRPLPARVTAADFVGVVEVRSVWPSRDRGEKYLQVAEATVIETLKGEDAPAWIRMNFDNGTTCNVIYKQDGRYLVFLVRQEDGTYSPVANTRYEVVNDAVDHWEGRGVVTLEQVRQDVTAAIVKAAMSADAGR